MQLEGTSRRLPIYLVVDISGSMAGASIEAVNMGLRDLEAALKSDPHALESAFISIIVFESEALQLSPLTEVGAFSPPTLETGGGTALGAAIRTLGQCLDTEFQEKTANQPGDWKPLVFLMTDGQPTDNWRPEVSSFKQRQKNRPANLIAIGCGPAADAGMLKELTEHVLLMSDLSPEKIRSLFQWISQSVKVTSKAASRQAAGAGGGQGAAPLPPPPSGFVIGL